jgi:ABC-type phosphate/phosphonate transport system ATPase subunit
MNSSAGVTRNVHFMRLARRYCRRILAMSALMGCAIVAPAVASLTRAPLHEVRLPRIDARLVEHLQRWADDEKEAWSEEI